LVLRTFPVVPWAAGITVLQAEGLQIIQWIAFGIVIVPGVDIRSIALADPFAKTVPFPPGHGNAFLHFVQGLAVYLIFQGIFVI